MNFFKSYFGMRIDSNTYNSLKKVRFRKLEIWCKKFTPVTFFSKDCCNKIILGIVFRSALLTQRFSELLNHFFRVLLVEIVIFSTNAEKDPLRKP